MPLASYIGWVTTVVSRSVIFPQVVSVVVHAGLADRHVDGWRGDGADGVPSVVSVDDADGLVGGVIEGVDAPVTGAVVVFHSGHGPPVEGAGLLLVRGPGGVEAVSRGEKPLPAVL